MGSAGSTHENEAIPSNRVLIVAKELTRGGAAHLALRYASRLCRHYPVDILVTGAVDWGFLDELSVGVQVYRLENVPTKPEPTALRTFHRVAFENRKLPVFQTHYRAVLATSVFPDWVACAAVAAVRASKRLLFLVDEGLAQFPDLTAVEQAILERCIQSSDMVLPVSRRLWTRMAERCQPLGRRPWTVVRPPIDVDVITERQPELPIGTRASDRLTVLTIARLSAEKQIDLCLKAHHKLKQSGIHFRWCVIGTGPEEPMLRAGIQRLGMENDFMLLANVPNIDIWINACDVFALCSAVEGCPTVVLEALAYGCPTLMTDVNGSDELIEHGKTGLIVANDLDSIASGLEQLLTNESLRLSFTEAIKKSGQFLPENLRVEQTILDVIAQEPVKNARPRVSILIPTYNQAAFVDQAVASALAQDYHSLEVIVGDDASTDGTGELANAWRFDPRFRYVRNTSNLGRVANYRRLLTELAVGKRVLMLDGDDYLTDPSFISRASDALDRLADRPVVFAQAGHRVHYLGGELPDLSVLPSIDGDEIVIDGAYYLQFVFETGFFTHLGTLYDRARALEANFYTATISSSDMDSLLRLALEGEVVLLNTVAGTWVQHGANASSGLPYADFAPNARIFRQTAQLAVNKGLTSWEKLEAPLTRYEARTLIWLFRTSIGKFSRGPHADSIPEDRLSGEPQAAQELAILVWNCFSSSSPARLFDQRMAHQRAVDRTLDFEEPEAGSIRMPDPGNATGSPAPMEPSISSQARVLRCTQPSTVHSRRFVVAPSLKEMCWKWARGPVRIAS